MTNTFIAHGLQQYAVTPEHVQLSQNLAVHYDTVAEVLNIRWEGTVDTSELRNGYTYILRLVQFFKPTRWVLDLQHRDTIKKEDQKWVFKHIFPRALRLLNQDVFVAVILPVHFYESLIHDLDGDDMIYGDKVLILEHFLYYEECLRWLNEMHSGSETA
ncbi:hypothetical protein H7F15_03370 [Pontibacter sp. Tf4]|uniref:hypothetical protein n=1 Tax=Pontibacter sp. Tf4 TaxID=2761620 RepID=UPI0016282FE3|nr:hypothetical protein [Pontibacter sp. Tf4]MBB6610067.1 hypothetical protein [Pontibacter sp. Tf4]